MLSHAGIAVSLEPIREQVIMIVRNSAELVTRIRDGLQTDVEYPMRIPVFVNSRDRLTCLRQVLAWLSEAGYRNVTIIDNASTYPPLVAFLRECSYPALRVKKNLGHTALWRIRELRSVIRNEWFVYTDPDILPIVSCPPPDVIPYLYAVMNRHPDYVKAGLGLLLTDIPDQYYLKQFVLRGQENLYGREVEPDVYEADTDTTFALYRPGTPYVVAPSLRTRGVYQARHLSWYADSAHLDKEDQYYRGHALDTVTHITALAKYASNPDLPLIGSSHETEEILKVMDDAPHFLKEVFHLKSWKVAAPLRWLENMFGTSLRINDDYPHMTRQQMRDEVARVLASHSWRVSCRLRQWKSKWQAAVK
jgi:hypothetical protein